MTYINEYGQNCDRVKTIEKLKGFKQDFYSVHVVSRQYNVRILLSLDENGEPIFLCIFNERDGKRNTDYSNYTKIVKARFLEITKGSEDNE